MLGKIANYSKSIVIKELEEETNALWYNRPALKIAVEILKDVPEENSDKVINRLGDIKTIDC